MISTPFLLTKPPTSVIQWYHTEGPNATLPPINEAVLACDVTQKNNPQIFPAFLYKETDWRHLITLQRLHPILWTPYPTPPIPPSSLDNL